MLTCNVVVWSDNFARFGYMRRYGLVVLGFRQCLQPSQLRLSIQLPLRLRKVLALIDPRGAILNSVVSRWYQNAGINRLVIRPRSIDIRSCVLVVIRLNVRCNGVFNSEIWFADKRRMFIASFERRGASE